MTRARDRERSLSVFVDTRVARLDAPRSLAFKHRLVSIGALAFARA
jgi:hypothetical protein